MAKLDPWREDTPAIKLGELALRRGLISEAQLMRALGLQEEETKKGRLPRQLGLILLSLGFLAEGDLIKILAEQEKQRMLMEKTEAPSPQTSPKEVAGQKDPPRILKKLPTLVVKPKVIPGKRY